MIICVVGPTGVGKTKLSEELATKYDAIVVNCDAMQVYKELDIGTAKIKEEEKKAKEHYLFDIKSPNEEYSVYDYQKDVRKILDDNKNRNIILVGGTGLYLKSGLFKYEFNDFPEKNEYDGYSNEELYDMLQNTGFSGEIHVNNRRRLISKLNFPINSGLKDVLLYSDVYFIGLTAPKDVLYEKINSRVDKMVEEGLFEEVRRVYDKYGKVRVLNRGIGYKEIIAYFEGKITYEETLRLIKQLSRKYAKRQYTWFNHQMNIKWVETDYDNFDKTIEEIEEYIEK